MVEFKSQLELFEPWPDGSVFGRDFETIGWAWPAWISPLCEMFRSEEIPQAEVPLGINATGFSNPDYDAACGTLLLSLPDTPDYSEAARVTQQILGEEMPTLPLYMRPRVIAHRNSICGIEVVPLSFSALWNLETIRECP